MADRNEKEEDEEKESMGFLTGAGGSPTLAPEMKRDNLAGHLAIAFFMALAVYVVAYRGIEWRRTRNGPWEVTFTNSPDGYPALVVEQAKLGLTNVEMIFADAIISSNSAATNFPSRLAFGVPKPVPFELPFGKCIFMDTTFLPGTLTVSMFGHEIEFLPRVMIIDHEEHPWRSGERIVLQKRN